MYLDKKPKTIGIVGKMLDAWKVVVKFDSALWWQKAKKNS